MGKSIVGLGALGIAAFFGYVATVVHARGESMTGPVVGAIALRRLF